MKRLLLICLTAFLIGSNSNLGEVHAQSLVNGGKTSVLLDTALLVSIGLNVTGTSGTLPGDLGAGSVGFGINARNGNLPTTFAYTPGSFAPLSVTIEHFGSVFFNQPAAPIEVGNFTIGFDASRVGGSRSGFFGRSTVGLVATLFDVENPSTLTAGANRPSVRMAEFFSLIGSLSTAYDPGLHLALLSTTDAITWKKRPQYSLSSF